MEKIQDRERLEKYYTKYEMKNLFTVDLLREFELVKVNRLEYICAQEDPMSYLCFLVEGKAKVVKNLSNGKTLLLSFYEPFEVIGDVELIQAIPAICTAQALTTCYLLVLSIEKFEVALKNDIKLLNFLCKELSDKLDRISNNSSINLLYPLESRLASYINMVAIESEVSTHLRYFNENLTQLAELLGVSYRHLLRILHGFCESNILSKEKEGYYRIINEEQLSNMADVIYK